MLIRKANAVEEDTKWAVWWYLRRNQCIHDWWYDSEVTFC
jgi:hypothetical protein